MLKARKRWISLLVTLAMLVTFAVPFVGPAAAATGIRALQVPNVSDDAWTKLGSVIVEVDPEALSGGDSLILTLPSDFKFTNKDVTGTTFKPVTDGYALSVGATVYTQITAPVSVSGTDNVISANDFTCEWLDDNQIKIELEDPLSGSGTGSDPEKVFIKVDMPLVYVDSGFSGDIKLTADAPSGSGFPAGDVVVGRVPGGAVSIAVMDTDTSADDFQVKLRIKENKAGAIEDDTDEALKFELPDGFEWDKSPVVSVNKLWGDDNMLNNLISNVAVDEEELTFGLDKDKDSTTETCFDITLSFSVTDETKAETGDVKVKISGDSTVDPKEAVVGTYGDYNVTIKADDPSVVAYAGLDEQDVSDITIKEALKGSLIPGRTILLTLPSNARWAKIDNQDIADAIGDSIDSDNGVGIEFVGTQGTNDRTAKFKITGEESSDAAELSIEDIQVELEAGVTGDLTVEVGGTANLDVDKIVLAKVEVPVTVKASAKPDVKIGLGSQAAGDITITEAKAGAIDDEIEVWDDEQNKYVKADTELLIDLPDGVKFDTVPDVKVTAGDLDIDEGNVQRSNDNNWLIIPIEKDSDEASTITISNIKYTIDRTVPEGPIVVKVKGSAVVQTVDEFPNSTTAASDVNANVITPAPGEQKGTAIFKIGEAKYTVNGKEVAMDVAPIAEAGRTYLPARFVANAMGVPDSNIIWDQANQTVTVIRDARIVQMKVGSNQILVNGIPLTMDVAPKVVPGRVLIPFRFLAQALGAEVVWDAADPNTITLNF